jgi:nitroimidazol reductase NimA-like FMN-containing flavoprotein (pyridoxamine 5'-phosphate oxidase superfamily)
MNEFREMRRKRQQLSNEESVAILEKATAGTLALLGDGDYPYAVPISYVYHEGKLFFHSALAGHKVDAIRKCEKASFCVIEQDDVQPKKYTTFFRSVIAFGRIHIIEDEQEKLETTRMLGNRYNPNDDESLQKEIESGFSRMLMIRFDIEHLTGKEAIELVKETHKKFYYVPAVGWDVCITEDGPIIIEGNDNFGGIGLQTICGGKAKVFRHFFLNKN